MVTAPLTVREILLEFSMIWVTFSPTAELIVVTALVPLPVLVIVPELFTAFVLITTLAPTIEPLLMTFKLPVPVIPPLTVKLPWEPTLVIVRLLPLRAMAPVKEGAVLLFEFCIVSVPTAPAARLIGFEIVNVSDCTVAEPPAGSPRVIAFADGPAAPETVVALLTPAIKRPFLTITPPEKVFAPERVKLEVELFWTTPVTLEPITVLIESEPVPVPELVIVPMWLSGVVETVIALAVELLLLSIKFPVVLAVPPETVKIVVPEALVRVVATALVVIGEFIVSCDVVLF